MSTQTDTDIAALVGEMEDMACEHSQHGSSEFHTDEPASHYLRGHCPACVPAGMVYPACPGFVRAVQFLDHLKCSTCGTTGPIADFITILGPVSA